MKRERENKKIFKIKKINKWRLKIIYLFKYKIKVIAPDKRLLSPDIDRSYLTFTLFLST